MRLYPRGQPYLKCRCSCRRPWALRMPMVREQKGESRPQERDCTVPKTEARPGVSGVLYSLFSPAPVQRPRQCRGRSTRGDWIRTSDLLTKAVPSYLRGRQAPVCRRSCHTFSRASCLSGNPGEARKLASGLYGLEACNGAMTCVGLGGSNGHNHLYGSSVRSCPCVQYSICHQSCFFGRNGL